MLSNHKSMSLKKSNKNKISHEYFESEEERKSDSQDEEEL